MGKVKDYAIWHHNKYGYDPHDWSHFDEYKKDSEWHREELEKVKKSVQNSLAQSSLSRTDYDLFISHASEDKEGFVAPLVDALRERHIKVWYDETEIKLGMSLRRTIDNGLSKSKFGLVVLSPAFLEKNWTQYELDALLQKELRNGRVILPIWHDVSIDDVMEYSAALADKLAIDSQYFSVDIIANKIAEVVKG